ncbi:MAG: glycoside hydrolase family 38 C-terminal domain-containing protein [Thermoproteota archaeon]
MTKEFVFCGNSHIDPVWLWRWNEGYWTVRNTVRNVVNLLKKYPEITFVFSSAVMYKWLEESEPELFEEVKALIKDGRWIPIGGSWVEPDCNLPSGESFVRQYLYGQMFFKEKLGVKVNIGYNIDSFGHNASFPKILKNSGIDFYIFMRPSAHEKELPLNIFYWESNDGSRVLAYRHPTSYGLTKSDIEKAITDLLQSKEPILLILFGKGDHGGGPEEEDITEILKIKEQTRSLNIKFGTPEEFFNKIKNSNLSIPIIRDELQHHASGCYSVLSEVKRLNRKAENSLILAERYSTISSTVTNFHYPKEKLRNAWEKVLFCQFHDSLAGTCIREAYEDIFDMFREAISVSNEIKNLSLQRISSLIDTIDNKVNIVIFNPSTNELKFPIEIEPAEKDIKLIDEDGKEVAFQEIIPSSLAGTRRIVFVADLPPLGFATYKVESIMSTENSEENKSMIASDYSLENEFIRVEFDEKNGSIRHIIDKEFSYKLFSGNAALPVVFDDLSDTWSHGVFSYKNKLSELKVTEVKLIEKGPVRNRVRVKYKYSSSSVIQDFIVYKGLKFIEVRVRIEWNEKHKLLKLLFPFNLSNLRYIYEIPFGTIERPANGEEEPGQKWVDVSGDIKDDKGKNLECGLTIINDAIYSFSAEENIFSMTLIRSPIYAHHIPNVKKEGVDYMYIDQGTHEFRYLLFPHKGSWKEVFHQISSLTDAINLGLDYTIEGNHKGSLPRKFSFISISDKNVYLSALKKAEFSNDIVLRIIEQTGKEKKFDIKFTLGYLKKSISVNINPFEVKTIAVPTDESIQSYETNFLEELR